MRAWRHCVLLAMLMLWPSAVWARAEFKLLEGAGFGDRTPVRPVGGNTGTTLGQQRRQVIERALAIWSERLDSRVPISIYIYFDELGCGPDGTAVAGTMVLDWLAPEPGSTVIYPAALANRIAGRDLVSERPDISIVFNSSLDAEPCRARVGGLYYGLDGKPDLRSDDLLSTALHEIAHGLGFASSIDVETGVAEMGIGVDSYSMHVRDLDLGRHWGELSEAERVRSAVNVRRVVFDGPETKRVAARLLARGEPTLELEPVVPGFSGWISDVGFARNPAAQPVSGPVMLADPLDGCSDPRGSVTGAIVVVEAGGCGLIGIAERLRRAGAQGVLLITPSPVQLPPMPLPSGPQKVDLPAVTIASNDAVAIARALSRSAVRARLGGSPDRSTGADAEGRPLLFTPTPVERGSTISHFEPLARPDPLMEPYTSEAGQDLDLTVAVLHDIGWTPFCGNGVLDADNGEVCDEGPRNSDAQGSTCRTSCRINACGDGRLDEGEECDDGARNDDRRADACRTSCVRPRCGDATVDRGEACDGTPNCTASCQHAGITPWSSETPTADRGDDDGCSLTGARRAPPAWLWVGLGLWVARIRRRARRR